MPDTRIKARLRGHTNLKEYPDIPRNLVLKGIDISIKKC